MIYQTKKEIEKGLYAGIMAKQYGFEDVLVPLIADACINALPKSKKSFNVDNVRTVKIPGGSVADSTTLYGFVLSRDSESSVKHVKNAKIACFGCNIDISSLDTKETVSIKSAEELLNYSKKEEKSIEDEIKAIKSAGINVIVSQGTFSEMALHFIEREGMMAVKTTSKFDMRRLCNATGAIPLVRIGKPTPEEIGLCDKVDVKEIGSTKCLVFQQVTEKSKVSTIILRGPTMNILDELERAVDNGVNIYKSFIKDTRLVGGAGSVEVSLYRGLLKLAEEVTTLDQYSMKKFAEAFLIIPKSIAETSGLSSNDAVTNLIRFHEEGKTNMGIDLYSTDGIDIKKQGIYDTFSSKFWGIKLATQAVLTILSVDQIIMARPSGGPKPPKQGGMDPDDDQMTTGGGGFQGLASQ